MTRYLLKTVNAEGKDYFNFKWPLTVGAKVSASNYDTFPQIVKGFGGVWKRDRFLYGLLNGQGDAQHLHWIPDAVWLVAEIPETAQVDVLVGRVKVDQCVIRVVGKRDEATSYLAARGHNRVVGAVLYGGNDCTLTGGHYSVITGGRNCTLVGGNRSVLRGGADGVLIGGEFSSIKAGDRSKVTGGFCSVLKGGGDSVVIGGQHSVVRGGYGSCLSLLWFDKERHRSRIFTAYVGEDGIEPYVNYTINDVGEFVRGDSMIREYAI